MEKPIEVLAELPLDELSCASLQPENSTKSSLQFSENSSNVIRCALNDRGIIFVKVDCARDDEPLTFTWSRDDVPLESNDRYRMTQTSKAVQLAIEHVQKDDTGHYTLYARTKSGEVLRKDVELIVEDRSVGDDPPVFLRRLGDLSVKVGTRTRLLVEIRSSTEVKVTWYRNDRRICENERIRYVHEGTFFCLEIAPVILEDGGQWMCMAENMGGRNSCIALLNVLVPKAYKAPEFIEELRAVLTEQGTVSLECKVIGIPTPVLRWFKDSKEIKAGDVFALTANPEDPTSLGTYTCEAVNCMGRAYSSSKVHVVGRGSREGSLKPADSVQYSAPPPIFTDELKDIRVKIGEPIFLGCKVVVPPWPKTVSWYNKIGRIDSSEKYRMIEDGLGVYMLEIKPSENCDEGEWKCVVTNNEGSVGISTCTVDMEIPKNYRKPRFMESLKAVLTEEGLVSFECKVVGFPTPILKWFKDGQELKPGDVYQLTGTNSLGTYCCVAKNCMGESSSVAVLTVEDVQNQLNDEERSFLIQRNQPPKFEIGLKSQEAKINEDFQFTVKVKASPDALLTWFRDELPIESNGKYLIQKSDNGTCSLSIHHAEFVDQAEWKCIASNDFGTSVTSCFLKLQIPRHYKKPRFLECLRAVLTEEGAVNLECKVIGVPQPVLKWYKDGVELKPGDIHKIISGQDGTCCLGTYTCEARNCMGIVASSASLLGFEEANRNQNQEGFGEELQRNLSLSTIQEERTSQLYDTPAGDITLEEKGDVSFSFDGKEVSVSLYETPDLTEEEALQIVEMYADQISEHVTEHNVVELPPLRFVKETSQSGNLLMEAVVIDIAPEYFSHEEDLRTEAGMDDISINEITVHQLSSGRESLNLDKETEDENEVRGIREQLQMLAQERKRRKSTNDQDEFYSLSSKHTDARQFADDDDTETDLQTFASVQESLNVSSNYSTSLEIGEGQAKLGSIPRSAQKDAPLTEPVAPKRKKIKIGTDSESSRTQESLAILQDISGEVGDGLKLSRTREPIRDDRLIRRNLEALIPLAKSLSTIEKNLLAIEGEVVCQSAMMMTATSAENSISVITNIIDPVRQIQSKLKVYSGEIPLEHLFETLEEDVKTLHRNLQVIEKCVEMDEGGRTLIQRTSVCIIDSCGDKFVDALEEVKQLTALFNDDRLKNELGFIVEDVKQGIQITQDTIKSQILIQEACALETTKHFTETIANLQMTTENVPFEKISFNELPPEAVAVKTIYDSVRKLQEAIQSSHVNIPIGSRPAVHIVSQEVANTRMLADSLSYLEAEVSSLKDKTISQASRESLEQKINIGILDIVTPPLFELRKGLERILHMENTNASDGSKKDLFEYLVLPLQEIQSGLAQLTQDIQTGIFFQESEMEQISENQRLTQSIAQATINFRLNVENITPLIDGHLHESLNILVDDVSKVVGEILDNPLDKYSLAILENLKPSIDDLNYCLRQTETRSSSGSLRYFVEPLQNLYDSASIGEDILMLTGQSSNDYKVQSLKNVQKSVKNLEKNIELLEAEHLHQEILAQSNYGEEQQETQLFSSEVLALPDFQRNVNRIAVTLEELQICIAGIQENIIQHPIFAESLLSKLDKAQSCLSKMKNIAVLSSSREEEIVNNVDLLQAVSRHIRNAVESLQILTQSKEASRKNNTSILKSISDSLNEIKHCINMHKNFFELVTPVSELESCLKEVVNKLVENTEDNSTMEDVSAIASSVSESLLTATDKGKQRVQVLLESLKENLADVLQEEIVESMTTLIPISQAQSFSNAIGHLHFLERQVALLQTVTPKEEIFTMSSMQGSSSVGTIANRINNLHSCILQIRQEMPIEQANENQVTQEYDVLKAIANPLVQAQQCIEVIQNIILESNEKLSSDNPTLKELNLVQDLQEFALAIQETRALENLENLIEKENWEELRAIIVPLQEIQTAFLAQHQVHLSTTESITPASLGELETIARPLLSLQEAVEKLQQTAYEGCMTFEMLEEFAHPVVDLLQYIQKFKVETLEQASALFTQTDESTIKTYATLTKESELKNAAVVQVVAMEAINTSSIVVTIEDCLFKICNVNQLPTAASLILTRLTSRLNDLKGFLSHTIKSDAEQLEVSGKIAKALFTFREVLVHTYDDLATKQDLIESLSDPLKIIEEALNEISQKIPNIEQLFTAEIVSNIRRDTFGLINATDSVTNSKYISFLNALKQALVSLDSDLINLNETTTDLLEKNSSPLVRLQADIMNAFRIFNDLSENVDHDLVRPILDAQNLLLSVNNFIETSEKELSKAELLQEIELLSKPFKEIAVMLNSGKFDELRDTHDRLLDDNNVEDTAGALQEIGMKQPNKTVSTEPPELKSEIQEKDEIPRSSFEPEQKKFIEQETDQNKQCLNKPKNSSAIQEQKTEFKFSSKDTSIEACMNDANVKFEGSKESHSNISTSIDKPKADTTERTEGYSQPEEIGKEKEQNGMKNQEISYSFTDEEGKSLLEEGNIAMRIKFEIIPEKELITIENVTEKPILFEKELFEGDEQIELKTFEKKYTEGGERDKLDRSLKTTYSGSTQKCLLEVNDEISEDTEQIDKLDKGRIANRTDVGIGNFELNTECHIETVYSQTKTVECRSSEGQDINERTTESENPNEPNLTAQIDSVQTVEDVKTVSFEPEIQENESEYVECAKDVEQNILAGNCYDALALGDNAITIAAVKSPETHETIEDNKQEHLANMASDSIIFEEIGRDMTEEQLINERNANAMSLPITKSSKTELTEMQKEGDEDQTSLSKADIDTCKDQHKKSLEIKMLEDIFAKYSGKDITKHSNEIALKVQEFVKTIQLFEIPLKLEKLPINATTKLSNQLDSVQTDLLSIAEDSDTETVWTKLFSIKNSARNISEADLVILIDTAPKLYDFLKFVSEIDKTMVDDIVNSLKKDLMLSIPQKGLSEGIKSVEECFAQLETLQDCSQEVANILDPIHHSIEELKNSLCLLREGDYPESDANQSISEALFKLQECLVHTYDNLSQRSDLADSLEQPLRDVEKMLEVLINNVPDAKKLFATEMVAKCFREISEFVTIAKAISANESAKHWANVVNSFENLHVELTDLVNLDKDKIEKNSTQMVHLITSLLEPFRSLDDLRGNVPLKLREPIVATQNCLVSLSCFIESSSAQIDRLSFLKKVDSLACPLEKLISAIAQIMVTPLLSDDEITKLLEPVEEAKICLVEVQQMLTAGTESECELYLNQHGRNIDLLKEQLEVINTNILSKSDLTDLVPEEVATLTNIVPLLRSLQSTLHMNDTQLAEPLHDSTTIETPFVVKEMVSIAPNNQLPRQDEEKVSTKVVENKLQPDGWTEGSVKEDNIHQEQFTFIEQKSQNAEVQIPQEIGNVNSAEKFDINMMNQMGITILHERVKHANSAEKDKPEIIEAMNEESSESPLRPNTEDKKTVQLSIKEEGKHNETQSNDFSSVELGIAEIESKTEEIRTNEDTMQTTVAEDIDKLSESRCRAGHTDIPKQKAAKELTELSDTAKTKNEDKLTNVGAPEVRVAEIKPANEEMPTAQDKLKPTFSQDTQKLDSQPTSDEMDNSWKITVNELTKLTETVDPTNQDKLGKIANVKGIEIIEESEVDKTNFGIHNLAVSEIESACEDIPSDQCKRQATILDDTEMPSRDSQPSTAHIDVAKQMTADKVTKLTEITKPSSQGKLDNISNIKDTQIGEASQVDVLPNIGPSQVGVAKIEPANVEIPINQNKLQPTSTGQRETEQQTAHDLAKPTESAKHTDENKVNIIAESKENITSIEDGVVVENVEPTGLGEVKAEPANEEILFDQVKTETTILHGTETPKAIPIDEVTKVADTADSTRDEKHDKISNMKEVVGEAIQDYMTNVGSHQDEVACSKIEQASSEILPDQDKLQSTIPQETLKLPGNFQRSGSQIDIAKQIPADELAKLKVTAEHTNENKVSMIAESKGTITSVKDGVDVRDDEPTGVGEVTIEPANKEISTDQDKIKPKIVQDTKKLSEDSQVSTGQIDTTEQIPTDEGTKLADTVKSIHEGKLRDIANVKDIQIGEADPVDVTNVRPSLIGVSKVDPANEEILTGQQIVQPTIPQETEKLSMNSQPSADLLVIAKQIPEYELIRHIETNEDTDMHKAKMTTTSKETIISSKGDFDVIKVGPTRFGDSNIEPIYEKILTDQDKIKPKIHQDSEKPSEDSQIRTGQIEAAKQIPTDEVSKLADTIKVAHEEKRDKIFNVENIQMGEAMELCVTNVRSSQGRAAKIKPTNEEIPTDQGMVQPPVPEDTEKFSGNSQPSAGQNDIAKQTPADELAKLKETVEHTDENMMEMIAKSKDAIKSVKVGVDVVDAEPTGVGEVIGGQANEAILTDQDKIKPKDFQHTEIPLEDSQMSTGQIEAAKQIPTDEHNNFAGTVESAHEETLQEISNAKDTQTAEAIQLNVTTVAPPEVELVKIESSSEEFPADEDKIKATICQKTENLSVDSQPCRGKMDNTRQITADEQIKLEETGKHRDEITLDKTAGCNPCIYEGSQPTTAKKNDAGQLQSDEQNKLETKETDPDITASQRCLQRPEDPSKALEKLEETNAKRIENVLTQSNIFAADAMKQEQAQAVEKCSESYVEILITETPTNKDKESLTNVSMENKDELLMPNKQIDTLPEPLQQIPKDSDNERQNEIDKKNPMSTSFDPPANRNSNTFSNDEKRIVEGEVEQKSQKRPNQVVLEDDKSIHKSLAQGDQLENDVPKSREGLISVEEQTKPTNSEGVTTLVESSKRGDGENNSQVKVEEKTIYSKDSRESETIRKSNDTPSDTAFEQNLDKGNFEEINKQLEGKKSQPKIEKSNKLGKSEKIDVSKSDVTHDPNDGHPAPEKVNIQPEEQIFDAKNAANCVAENMKKKADEQTSKKEKTGRRMKRPDGKKTKIKVEESKRINESTSLDQQSTEQPYETVESLGAGLKSQQGQHEKLLVSESIGGLSDVSTLVEDEHLPEILGSESAGVIVDKEKVESPFSDSLTTIAEMSSGNKEQRAAVSMDRIEKFEEKFVLDEPFAKLPQKCGSPERSLERQEQTQAANELRAEEMSGIRSEEISKKTSEDNGDLNVTVKKEKNAVKISEASDEGVCDDPKTMPGQKHNKQTIRNVSEIPTEEAIKISTNDTDAKQLPSKISTQDAKKTIDETVIVSTPLPEQPQTLGSAAEVVDDSEAKSSVRSEEAKDTIDLIPVDNKQILVICEEYGIVRHEDRIEMQKSKESIEEKQQTLPCDEEKNSPMAENMKGVKSVEAASTEDKSKQSDEIETNSDVQTHAGTRSVDIEDNLSNRHPKPRNKAKEKTSGLKTKIPSKKDKVATIIDGTDPLEAKQKMAIESKGKEFGAKTTLEKVSVLHVDHQCPSSRKIHEGESLGLERDARELQRDEDFSSTSETNQPCVNYKKTTHLPPLAFDVRLSNQTVSVGSTAKFVCNVQGNSPTARWYRNGEEILNNEQKHLIQCRNGLITMEIKNVEESDAAEYRCVVSSNGETLETKCQLSVFNPADLEVSKGKPIFTRRIRVADLSCQKAVERQLIRSSLKEKLIEKIEMGETDGDTQPAGETQPSPGPDERPSPGPGQDTLQVPTGKRRRIKSPTPGSIRGRSMTPVRGRSRTPFTLYMERRSATPSTWRSITPFLKRESREKTPFELGTSVKTQLDCNKAVFDKALIMDITEPEVEPARYITTDLSVIDRAAVMDVSNVEVIYVVEEYEEYEEYTEEEDKEEDQEKKKKKPKKKDKEAKPKKKTAEKKKEEKERKEREKSPSPKLTLKLEIGPGPKASKKLFEKPADAAPPPPKPKEKPPPKKAKSKLALQMEEQAKAAAKAAEEAAKKEQEKPKRETYEERQKRLKAEKEAEERARAELQARLRAEEEERRQREKEERAARGEESEEEENEGEEGGSDEEGDESGEGEGEEGEEDEDGGDGSTVQGDTEREESVVDSMSRPESRLKVEDSRRGSSTSKDSFVRVDPEEEARWQKIAEEEGQEFMLKMRKASEIKAKSEKERDADWQKQREAARLPTFINFLTDRTAEVGNNVRLACAVDGPDLSAKWFKDGRQIERDARHRINNNNNILSLEIVNCTTADSGEYACVISNPNDEVTSSCIVTIYEVYKDEPRPPAFTLIRDFYHLHDDELTIECHVSGIPRPKIKWVKDAIELQPNFKYTMLEEAHGVCKLMIYRPSSKDSGTYVCKATNDSGELDISHKVEFVKEKKFHVHGVFHAHGEIQKDKEEAARRAMEEAMKSKQEYDRKRGAEDGPRRTRASIEEPVATKNKLKFASQLRDRIALEGGKVKLVCSILGPNPNVRWLKDDKPVVLGPKVRNLSSENVGALELSEVTSDSSGVYKCIAKNDYSEIDTSCYLKVYSAQSEGDEQEPMFVLPMRDVYHSSENDLVIDTKVRGNPRPKISWLKDEMPIENDGRIQQIEHLDGVCELVINKPTPKDNGKYSCVADNKLGIQKTTHSVLLEVLPPSRRSSGSMGVVEEKEAKAKKPSSGGPDEKGKPPVKGQKKKTEADDIGGGGRRRHESPEVSPKNKLYFAANMTNRYLASGSKVKMSAVIVGPDPQIKWLKDGNNVAYGPRIKNMSREGLAVLEINNAVPEDSGTYSVIARNPASEISSDALLHIYDAKVSADLEPMFTRALKDTYRLNTNELILESHVRGEPMPKVAWVKDGIELQNSEKYQIIHYPDGTCELIVDKPTNKDSGKYVCQAENGVGKAEISHFVLFEGKESHIAENIHGVFHADPQLLKKTKEPDDKLTVETADSKGDGEEGKGKGKTKGKAAGKRSSVHEVVVAETKSYKEEKREKKVGIYFAAKLSDRVVAEGSKVKLTCYVEGPEPGVRWFKNEQPVVYGPKVRQNYREGLCTLELLSASESDSGTYQCYAKNNNGEASTECKVTVYASPKSADVPPTFTRSIKDTYHGKINELVLDCHVRGLPTPTVSWVKDGVRIEPSDKYQQIDHADGSCELIINDPVPYDSGKYVCQAENRVDKSEISHIVHLAAKDIRPGSPSREIARKEEVVAAEAGKDAKQESNKKGGEKKEAKSKAGKKAAVEEGGGGRRTAAPLPDPKKCLYFGNFLSNRTVPEGSTLRMTVFIGGPDPQIRWLKDEQVVVYGPKSKSACQDGLATLVLSSLTPSDSGEYKLVARNSENEIISSCRVTVYAKSQEDKVSPVFTVGIKDTYYLNENELVLDCRIRGNPRPEISWMKDTDMITNDSKYQQLDQADGHCKLIIRDPTEKDSGTYTCRAENAAGSDKMAHVVDFKGRERFILEKAHGFFHRDPNKPHLTNILGDHIVPVGGTVAIQAEFGQTSSPIEVQWLKEKSALPAADNIRTFVDHGVYTLAIEKATAEISGTYTCRASNAFGRLESNANVHIVAAAMKGGKPALFLSRPESEMKIAVHDPFSISFRVQGDPKPKLTLLKGTKDITKSERVSKEAQEDYIRFTVHNSTISDSGTYFVVARNQHGTDRLFVTVTVKVPKK